MLTIQLTVWRVHTQRISIIEKQNQEGNTFYELDAIEDLGHHANNKKDGRIRRDLTKKEIERLMALLDEITISPAPKHCSGHGDKSYMLNLENRFTSASYKWCNEPPKGWEHLKELTDFLVDVSKEQVAESDARLQESRR